MITPPRDIPAGVLAELHNLALVDLADLRERLEAGQVELLDMSVSDELNPDGKPDGVRTYTFIVRKS